jgi:hypothetical protein
MTRELYDYFLQMYWNNYKISGLRNDWTTCVCTSIHLPPGPIIDIDFLNVRGQITLESGMNSVSFAVIRYFLIFCPSWTVQSWRPWELVELEATQVSSYVGTWYFAVWWDNTLKYVGNLIKLEGCKWLCYECFWCDDDRCLVDAIWSILWV